MSNLRITIDSVRSAAKRIAPFVCRTPVQQCRALSERAGRELWLKCEQFQRGGAFKFRGASNAVMSLSQADAARGVMTHSSGNHGQALALAARMRGIPAFVVMPENASPVKVEAVRGYGAQIHFSPPTLEGREAVAERLQRETGAFYVPPYNHPDVIAGQGTVALELLEQVDRLEAIVAPVGGGGLISGISVAAKALDPGIRVFAAEPAGADDAMRSKRAGRLIQETAPETLADGLRTSLGDLTWPFIRDQVERVITVTDDETVRAMRLVWERAKLLIEPSSAVAVAAVLGDEFRRLEGISRVGIVLSGGNVDLDRLPW